MEYLRLTLSFCTTMRIFSCPRVVGREITHSSPTRFDILCETFHIFRPVRTVVVFRFGYITMVPRFPSSASEVTVYQRLKAWGYASTFF
jgi:hypothetical protein